MNFEQLGIIVFFGILIPGTYLTAVLLFVFVGFLKLIGIPIEAKVLPLLSEHALLFSTCFLFVSYLFGIVIRLFSVRIVDKHSVGFLRARGWFLRKIFRT